MNLTPSEKTLFAILIVAAIIVGALIALATNDWTFYRV